MGVINHYRWGAMAVLIIVLLVEGCDVPGFPEWQWRQKVTVEVEGPTEPLSAASVMEVICGSSPQWLRGIGGGGLGCQLQGEAVSLEIAPSQVLFALLTGAPGSQNYPKKVAYHVFFPDRTLTTVEERGEQLEKGFHGEVRDLPRQNYPLLVTFTDINDPKTVQKVDPDNLAATFGPGVSLKRMTLEITDEPVTEGKIESVLGWYWGYRDKGYRLNGKKCVACPVSSENLADLIGPGEFKIGGNK